MAVDWEARAASAEAGRKARERMDREAAARNRIEAKARREALTVRINLTDGDGILLGQVTMTGEELHRARMEAPAAIALADELAQEAGVW